MLSIGPQQMADIEVRHRAGEPAWAQAWLKAQRPAWCAARSEEALQLFCWETLDFGHACGFHQRASLARLLQWRADGRLPAPFSDWHKFLLTRPGFDEESRLQQFEQALESSEQPVLIRLDTDLGPLRRPQPARAAAGAPR